MRALRAVAVVVAVALPLAVVLAVLPVHPIATATILVCGVALVPMLRPARETR